MKTIVPSPEPPAEATCTPEIEEVALGPSNLPPGAAVRGGGSSTGSSPLRPASTSAWR